MKAGGSTPALKEGRLESVALSLTKLIYVYSVLCMYDQKRANPLHFFLRNISPLKVC